MTYSGGQVQIEIMDITYPLVSPTDYMSTTTSTTDSDGDPAVIVTITGQNNYSGTWTSDPIKVTQGPEKLVNLEYTTSAGVDGIPGVFDYNLDLGGVTYQLENEKIAPVWIQGNPTKNMVKMNFRLLNVVL
ncbi:hypothetical protein C823_006084 [Eubacterium plexicaudatum ASF492]|nr:hypothetical protein C823_006084 [Eubacterium plexicaudatum ASF492]